MLYLFEGIGKRKGVFEGSVVLIMRWWNFGNHKWGVSACL